MTNCFRGGLLSLCSEFTAITWAIQLAMICQFVQDTQLSSKWGHLYGKRVQVERVCFVESEYNTAKYNIYHVGQRDFYIVTFNKKFCSIFSSSTILLTINNIITLVLPHNPNISN